MFVLTLIRQTVRVPAEKFGLPIDSAIAEELNHKFANKVCKPMFDLLFIISCTYLTDGYFALMYLNLIGCA